MVFWNTTASSYIVQNPQTAQNWIIGGTGPVLDETRFGPQPPPTVDAHDTPVDFGRTDNPTSSTMTTMPWCAGVALPSNKPLVGDDA